MGGRVLSPDMQEVLREGKVIDCFRPFAGLS